MKICIPIMAENVSSALRKMIRAFPMADILELRIDRIGDVNMKRLLERKRENILVTNRRKEEGGGFGGREMERVALLKEAASLGTGYVDIEAGTDVALIRELKEAIRKGGQGTKLIVSHHDLRGTPGMRTLRKRLDECVELGADMVKIVTSARTMEDNLRVLSLISPGRKKGVDVIAFCMGEMGRVSRVMAPLFGSCITFASLDKGEESASGQFTAEEIRKILKGLEGSRVQGVK
jgi:3-dehydroquinate dehydratase type I